MNQEEQIFGNFSSYNKSGSQYQQNQSSDPLQQNNQQIQSHQSLNQNGQPKNSQKDHHYKCLKCQKKYFVKKSYFNHLRSHQLSYKCKFYNCDKKFNQQSSLQRHFIVHTKQQPFQCDFDQCDKKFNQKSNLNRHKKIHKNQKKFICTKCCKKFSTTTNLKQHEQIHVQNKQQRKFFNCQVQGCDKKYLYMCNLKKHAKDHSDPLGNIIADNTPYEWTFSVTVVSCKIKIVVDIDSVQNLNKDHSETKITYKQFSGAIKYNPDQFTSEKQDLDQKISDLLFKAKGAVSLSIEIHPCLESIMTKIIERIIAFNDIVGSKSIMIKIKDYMQFVNIISFLLKNYGPQKQQKLQNQNQMEDK